jgi:predicted dehydrogenase
MSRQKVKVSLVGCGQIADAHLQEIRRIPVAKVVAACDRHLDLARQAAARFDVPGVYDDFDRMLEETRPDVVHVATPPASHRPLALRSLESGAHVYVEKPFAIDAAEADEVLAAARARGRLVCVGHDQLFDPAWEECRRLVREGALGEVVHVDAVQGYDLSGPFGRLTASEPDHWVHRLPGGLFHNTIPHAVYPILDFLRDERPLVWATWFGNLTGGTFPTELRVMLRGTTVTGTLLSSSAARPVQRLTRVYGTRRCVEVDLNGRLVRHYRSAALRGPFAKIEMPFRHLTEAGRNLRWNLGRFLTARLHFFTGMNRLFTLFYQAVQEGGEPPIPYAEIHRTTAIMDRIFDACRSEAAGAGPLPDPRNVNGATAHPAEAAREGWR